MVLHFYLRYSTKYGQAILVSGNTETLGNNDFKKAFLLEYLNDQFWHGYVEIDEKFIGESIQYKYILREENADDVAEFGNDRIIDTSKYKAQRLVLTDVWNHPGTIENVFYSSPFKNVLLKYPATVKSKDKILKNFTHEFRVKAPLLSQHETLCIGGSAAVLNNWAEDKVAPMKKEGDWFTVKLQLPTEAFPFTYKYGIFNKKDKKFIRYEEGNNRLLLSPETNNTINIIHDGFANLQNINWKGAGVAIPVFSLRSKKGLGTGEITDLKLLVDWARETGLSMIQLLPINDTTATYTWRDSYPYAAISAFALHPLLINLDAVAGKDGASIIKQLAKKKKVLNNLSEIDYEQVLKIKLDTLKELYRQQKDSFKNDSSFFSFFELNRHWLEPYAAFCYLRDKYKTADFSKWKQYVNYDESAIQQLISSQQNHHDEIAFFYFVQYHLHQQLKDATEYAHKHAVIIKGDIPIGICKNSVDAWMEPELYHMDTQAGAPPDAFTAKGQNWGFPTYNWKKMQADDFAWWRRRFEQMSNYFDAFRIDHILGFFRIWSIPSHAVEGIMGRFVPAIPVSINEIFGNNILFERFRYTKPFISEDVLNQLFGDKKEEVKKTFLDKDKLKPKFDTQRKVEEYFAGLDEPDNKIKLGLFDLISNVIFFDDEEFGGQKFHFRFSMEETSSFKNLEHHSQDALRKLYVNYFFHRQDELWRKEAMKKLPGLKQNTNMLVCGEDLGLVPHCVPEVMERLGILSLEIQRMPKKTGIEFFHPNDAPYLSVVSPSTHDMSTIRAWWEEDAEKTRRFYNHIMGQHGMPPKYCEPWINKEIILQHLYSPAIWSVFQMQDLLGMHATLRRENPSEERINNPANPEHYWNYRMHINLETLLKETAFNEELKTNVKASGR